MQLVRVKNCYDNGVLLAPKREFPDGGGVNWEVRIKKATLKCHCIHTRFNHKKKTPAT